MAISLKTCRKKKQVSSLDFTGPSVDYFRLIHMNGKLFSFIALFFLNVSFYAESNLTSNMEGMEGVIPTSEGYDK